MTREEAAGLSCFCFGFRRESWRSGFGSDLGGERESHMACRSAVSVAEANGIYHEDPPCCTIRVPSSSLQSLQRRVLQGSYGTQVSLGKTVGPCEVQCEEVN